MSVKTNSAIRINYSTALPQQGDQSRLYSQDIKLNYKLSIPSWVYSEPAKPFTAQPRPKEDWTAADYAITAFKVLFFPITAVHYLISLVCSVIALPLGVGKAKEIDASKRDELKSLGGKEIEFITEDHLKIEGMHFVNPRAVPGAQTILICSGSHESYEKYTVPMVDALLKQGHHAMVFNYRGFGNSEGIPTEEGFNLDAEAAYQYLKSVQQKSDPEIAVLGYSMGTGPATDLAAHHKIKLVLDRYFSSMKNCAGDMGGWIAKAIFYLGGADFDVKETIKQVKGRIFLASGLHDTTMKPYHEEYLKSAIGSNPNATFVKVDSSHIHNSKRSLWFHPENPSNSLYQGQLQAFLRSPA